MNKHLTKRNFLTPSLRLIPALAIAGVLAGCGNRDDLAANESNMEALPPPPGEQPVQTTGLNATADMDTTTLNTMPEYVPTQESATAGVGDPQTSEITWEEPDTAVYGTAGATAGAPGTTGTTTSDTLAGGAVMGDAVTYGQDPLAQPQGDMATTDDAIAAEGSMAQAEQPMIQDQGLAQPNQGAESAEPLDQQPQDAIASQPPAAGQDVTVGELQSPDEYAMQEGMAEDYATDDELSEQFALEEQEDEQTSSVAGAEADEY